MTAEQAEENNEHIILHYIILYYIILYYIILYYIILYYIILYYIILYGIPNKARNGVFPEQTARRRTIILQRTVKNCRLEKFHVAKR